MPTTDLENLRAYAKSYGTALVAALNARLPKELRKLTALDISRFVTTLTETQIVDFLTSVHSVHAEHGPGLLEYASTSAPDEVVVLDPSTEMPPDDEVSRLLIYAELLVWPDPLLE